MSDFNNYNGFENPTPPDNNQPDYSYSWNGSNNNGNKGKHTPIIIALIILVVVVAVAVFVSQQESLFDDIFNNQTSGDNSDASDTNSKKNNKGETSRPDYSVPDFTPSGDANLDLSTTLTEIYDHCSPSCCTISVSKSGKEYSSGSGFVIDAENGYVATNHHVIDDGDKIEVVFYDGSKYEATLVGSDSTTDLAVLKIEAENLVSVEFGSSENIKVGEYVVAIGTPYDKSLAGTMTCGIVSGLARGIEITNSSGKVIKTMTLIQTDCSINPGNSGGPLIDMAGNVIGITSLKLVDEQYEGIGFAIPITDASKIFQQLIAGEDITDSNIATAAPRIGVTVYELEYGLEYFYMDPSCEYPKGVLVGEIDRNTSAFEAGLDRFDIITDFNGHAVTDLETLDKALSNFKAGDEVEVTVFRFNRKLTSGEYVTIKFKLNAAE